MSCDVFSFNSIATRRAVWVCPNQMLLEPHPVAGAGGRQTVTVLRDSVSLRRRARCRICWVQYRGFPGCRATARFYPHPWSDEEAAAKVGRREP